MGNAARGKKAGAVVTDIQSLRKIAEEATQGGWVVDGSRFNHYLGSGIGQVWGINWRNDLQFITTFHPLQVLALLDRVEKAERRIARLRNREQKAFGKLRESKAALQRVREVHVPYMEIAQLEPDLDRLDHCTECGVEYPCPTIRALEGGQR